MPQNQDNSNFPPISYPQWKQKVQYELKGADYNEELTWESPEGIRVNPVYTESQTTLALPAKDFSICQDLFVFDVEKTARRAASSLKRGADSLRLRISNPQTDVTQLLSVLSQSRNIFFDLDFFSIDFIEKIKKEIPSKGPSVHFLIDPIYRLASTGNWLPGGDNFSRLNEVISTFPEASVVSVNAALYQESGATRVQEIGFAVAHALDYLNKIDINKPIVFEMAIGPEYFFEIAKLRALRLVFASVAKAIGHSGECRIYASPTHRDKTLYDYNVNMLRTTTQCMSAVLGGSDTICNLPYDAIYHKSNEFGERIARNQLLILKHESYFSQMPDPASGSFYIEDLTAKIAQKALDLVKKIEAEGGFTEHLKKGQIQRWIKQEADASQNDFDSGKTILVGTNKYPDASQKMGHDLELYPFLKKKPRKTLITPIIPRRLAEANEQQRLENEQTP